MDALKQQRALQLHLKKKEAEQKEIEKLAEARRLAEKKHQIKQEEQQWEEKTRKFKENIAGLERTVEQQNTRMERQSAAMRKLEESHQSAIQKV